MGAMKQLLTVKADELASTQYGKDFYTLPIQQQNRVWNKAIRQIEKELKIEGRTVYVD